MLAIRWHVQFSTPQDLDPEHRISMSTVMTCEWLEEEDADDDAFVKEMRSRPIAEGKDLLLQLTWLDSDAEARKVRQLRHCFGPVLTA